MMKEEQDQISHLIGDFGKWQALLILPLGVHFVFGSFQTLVTSFLSLEADFYCQIEAPDGIFESLEQWRNFSNPVMNDTTVDKCHIYDLDYTLLSKLAMERGATADEFTDVGNNLITTKNCTQFVFDDSKFESSIVTDFNLVCGKEWQITLAQSLYMLGIFIGASGSGIISDRFGRRKTIMFFSVIMSIFSIAVAFSNSMMTFILLRMILACSSVGFWTTFYVYAMEIVGGKWKTLFGIGFEFPWAVAYSVLPGIAYAERNWRNLQLIISVPPVILVIFYYFLPESPRWLLSKNRTKEAEEILRQAARRNQKTWDESVVLETPKEEESSANFLDLFKTPNLCKNTLIQYFNWFAASFVYYALTLDSGTLIPGDIYVNFAVSGLIEFPAYTLSIFLLYYLGRRGPLAFMYYLLGGSLLLSLAMPNAQGILAMATIGKFGSVCAFAIIYVQAVEIFPTVIRNTGIGSSSSVARIGSILAPIIGRELGKKNRELVIIIFSLVALLAGTGTLFLPETLGKNLPDSVADGEAFGKGESAFDVCLKKDKKEKPAAKNHTDELGLENTAFEK